MFNMKNVGFKVLIVRFTIFDYANQITLYTFATQLKS